MASKRVKDGPHWVKAWISELSALTDQFRDMDTGAVDFEALGREEYHFRMALSRRDFTNSERARKVWEDAVGNYQQRIKAASKDKEQGDASHREEEDESATVSNPLALDSLDDKASDPNCGADAVNRKTTVDRKSSTSAPQQRPWKEMVEKSLGISETDKSGTGKGVRPPNHVPGLLRKMRAAGSPLKPGTGPSPAARSLPKSMAEVADFATSEGLDYDDCRLWWEQNFVERKGKDKDGRKITNWKGALIRFCASAKRKRESA